MLFAINDINNRQINQLELLCKYSSLIDQAPSCNITNLSWFEFSIMRWQANWTRLKFPSNMLDFQESYIIFMESFINLPDTYNTRHTRYVQASPGQKRLTLGQQVSYGPGLFKTLKIKRANFPVI